MKYDYLIVGSGLFGSTFAFKAWQKGKRCLVIEKRPHTGGNAYCETRDGICVHMYGPHIFHTSDSRVWDFVNSLTAFAPYILTTLARWNNEIFNLPFNMNTFCQMWPTCRTPQDARRIIEEQRKDMLESLNGREPVNLEEQAISLVGKDIYRKLIAGYTEKQWGRPCKELPASIIKRLPVRYTFNNNYYNDPYSGIPVRSYNALFAKLLEGADVALNVDFFNSSYRSWKVFADKLVYTGPMDQYFDYKCGRLEWRSLEFVTKRYPFQDNQGVSIVNYTDASVPFTRIVEHKHFAPWDIGYKEYYTYLTQEYPRAWKPGMEQYYPINTEENQKKAEAYRKLQKAEKDVIFGGRLADYTYYDMDKVIAKALEASE